MNNKVEARITEIQIGRLTYYQPQVRRRFLFFWHYWTAVFASKLHARCEFGGSNVWKDKSICSEILDAFADLTDSEIELVD